MSYVLVGEGGYAADFASNLGMMQLEATIIEIPGLPATKEFLNKGMTTEPADVVRELAYMLEVFGKRMSQDVVLSIEALLEGLMKTKEVAIITQ